jgi:hypothetical protein
VVWRLKVAVKEDISTINCHDSFCPTDQKTHSHQLPDAEVYLIGLKKPAMNVRLLRRSYAMTEGGDNRISCKGEMRPYASHHTQAVSRFRKADAEGNPIRRLRPQCSRHR